MTDKEIAMQITLKAIECNVIKFISVNNSAEKGSSHKEIVESTNEFNTNSIAQFYSSIYKELQE